MSRRKTERLLNLVICLLSTTRPLSAEQIRFAVPGYDPANDEAFQRMFERDKNELREIGIPIEVQKDPWEDDPGYRIVKQSYELPEITLEPDEAAVLGLAAQVWQRASLAEAAGGAMLKLQGGRGRDRPGRRASGAAGRHPRRGVHPAVGGACATAGPSPSTTAPAAASRCSSAWSSRGACCPGAAGGTWSATTAPATAPASSGSAASSATSRRPGRPGTVRGARGHRPARAGGVRRRRPRPPNGPPRCASAPAPARACATSRGRSGRGADWDEADIVFTDPERLAGWLASLGPDAVVDGPPDAREAVIRRLKGCSCIERPAAPAARPRALPDVPPRRLRARGRQGLRAQREAAHRGPPAGLDVRPARPHPRRPDRRLLGRRRDPHRQRRHDRPPPQARRRRGQRPAGRAADARRAARVRRRRGARPGRGQAGAGRRRRRRRDQQPGHRRGRGRPRRARDRHRRARGAGAGSRSSTTPRAATRSPRARSTRCGWPSSTAATTSRAGATGPRRCGCSGWTGSRRSPSSTSRPTRPPRPSRWTSPRASSAPPRPTNWSSWR